MTKKGCQEVREEIETCEKAPSLHFSLSSAWGRRYVSPPSFRTQTHHDAVVCPLPTRAQGGAQPRAAYEHVGWRVFADPGPWSFLLPASV